MSFLIVILLSIALISIAFLGLATKMLLKRGGKFPNTHIGGNKFLVDKGIYCAQTTDRLEREKAKKQIDFKSMKIAKVSE
ncbi:MAG: hypothetical protein GX792_05255 [Bacteroidales bacterium]|jgi:hypothetical protein|nr:hypothetical protein [Bacteroidales bacterium]